MNKKEFVNEVARRAGINKYAVDDIYGITYELVIERLLRDESIELPRLGTFSLVHKNAKGLLCGDRRSVEKKCTYPSFKLNDGLKKRIKNRNIQKSIQQNCK